MARQATYAVFGLILLTGCVANPQPVPLPIDDEAVFFSGSALGSDEVFVAGGPGAVAEPGQGAQVIVRNLARDIRSAADIGADGSFVVVASKAGFERLEMWVVRDGLEGPRVLVRQTDVIPPTPPAVDPTIDDVGAVIDGRVTIRGTASQPLVMVCNPLRAACLSAPPQNDQWSVTIRAEVGDQLLAFGVDTSFFVGTEPIRVQIGP